MGPPQGQPSRGLQASHSGARVALKGACGSKPGSPDVGAACCGGETRETTGRPHPWAPAAAWWREGGVAFLCQARPRARSSRPRGWASAGGQVSRIVLACGG